MKKTRLKERLNNAIDAFWQDGENIENELVPQNFGETLLLNEDKDLSNNFRKIFRFLKQILLFLPGTFFTFYLWMGVTIFGFPRGKSFLFLLVLIVSPLSMVIGLGSIKKIKDWIMPLSVAILGVIIGFLSAGFDFIRDFENAVLFFPLALIVAVLSKNLVDSLSQEVSG